MQGYGLSVKVINAVMKVEMAREGEGKHIWILRFWKHVGSHTHTITQCSLFARDPRSQDSESIKFSKRLYNSSESLMKYYIYYFLGG